MKKVLSTAMVLTILATTLTTPIYASSVTGIRSLNNEERKIDYKITDQSIKDVADIVLTNSDGKEVILSSPEREIGSLISNNPVAGQPPSGDVVIPDEKFRPLTSPLEEQQLAWLVENNIISREKQIVVGPTDVKVDRKESLYNSNSPLDPMNRTDFLVGAYKAIYGPISSRPLLIKTEAWRDAEMQYLEPYEDEDGETRYRIAYYPKEVQKVSGTGETYRYIPYGDDKPQVSTFPEGDYYEFVSPNVVELYLKELLDKGIVDVDSISDMEFREAYRSLGSSAGNQSRVFPRWYNNQAPFMVSGGANQKDDLNQFYKDSRVWGRSFSILAGGSGCIWTGDVSCKNRGYSDSVVTINYLKSTSNVPYFVEEKIDSMSALKYVESMLRLTEKDMTDTEARIITYKYGASYLNQLDEEDRKTVMFLTAKGVLNFEDDTEYRNLYGELSKEFAYKLMYRLANKNARLDFSKIQLTDSDNFWIDNGFGQSKITMNYLNDVEHDKFRNDDGSYPFSPLPEVETLSVEELPTTVADAEVSVKRSFLGINLFTAKSSYAAPKTRKYNVKKVFDSAEKYKYRGISLKDTERIKTAQWVKDVSGPTTKDFRVTVSFELEASSPAMAIATIDSNISIGTDFLFEKSDVTAVSKYKGEDGKMVTLVPASVFRDNGPKLGQKILVMEDKVLKNVETGATAILLKERNMALVGTHVITGKDLMVESINGEVYYNLEVIKALLSNTYISTLDPHSLYISTGILNETLANVVPETGNSIGKTYVAQFEVNRDGDVPTSEIIKAPFVNISQLTTASNFLIKEFEVKDSVTQKPVKFKMIMHLVYTLPDKDTNFLNPVYKKNNPSFSEVNKYIYEKPEDPELADWWDNNLELSNAFANVFYGTKGVPYVKSGYLVPNITVLYDENNKNVVKKKYLQQVFEEVGTHLSEDWVNKFIGDLSSYNKVVKKGDKDTNQGSVYFPDKPLPVGEFPKWVHAMFNNTEGGAQSKDYAGKPGSSKKNTSLWRNLMADRTLTYQLGVSPAKKGITIYQTGQETYVETSGGAVYLRIDPTNAKYPSKLVADGKTVEEGESWKGKKSFTFKPQTRTEANNLDDWLGKTVTDPTGKYTFYVKDVDENKLLLVDTSYVVGKPVASKRGDKDFFDISGVVKDDSGKTSGASQTAIKTRYNELRALFTGKGLSGYENTVPSFENSKTVAWYPQTNAMSNRLVYIDKGSKKLDKAKDKVYYESSAIGTSYSFNQVSTGKLNAKPVYAFASIHLNANLWSISADGKLVPRKTFPFLQVGNVYFSGINNTLMDSIIAKHVGTVSVNKIEEGAKLLIGDMQFTRRGDVFVSEPQENMKSWLPLLKNAENKTTVKNTILRSFTGMGITKGNIEVSNTPLPIISFIRNPTLTSPSPQDRKITLLGSENGKSALVYYYKKDGSFTTKAYNRKNIPAVSGVTFSVQLDDVLRARKVDSDSKAYVLMMSTNSLSEGYLEDVPFFNESLGLNVGEDLVIMADKSNFKPLSNALDLKENFLSLYTKTRQGDIASALKLAGVSLLSLISLISILFYPVLKYKPMHGLLETLKYPRTSSDRQGIDLIKIASLGIFNLESELKLSKLIVSNLFLFSIMYMILQVA